MPRLLERGEFMRKIGVSREKVNILSTAISEYVHGLGNNELIEGVFVLPCGFEEVDNVILGIVYNNWRMKSNILQSDKGRLHMLSGCVGVNIQVKDFDIEKFYDYFAYREYDQPVKAMLKSGRIIYDSNGKLKDLQEQLKFDRTVESLEARGAVEIEPAIQYRKVRY